MSIGKTFNFETLLEAESFTGEPEFVALIEASKLILQGVPQPDVKRYVYENDWLTKSGDLGDEISSTLFHSSNPVLSGCELDIIDKEVFKAMTEHTQDRSKAFDKFYDIPPYVRFAITHTMYAYPPGFTRKNGHVRKPLSILDPYYLARHFDWSVRDEGEYSSRDSCDSAGRLDAREIRLGNASIIVILSCEWQGGIFGYVRLGNLMSTVTMDLDSHSFMGVDLIDLAWSKMFD